MVLFLVTNVVLQARQVAFRYREGGIASLPFENPAVGDQIVQQTGRDAFYLVDKLGDGNSRREAHQEMDMILNAAEGLDLCFEFGTFRLNSGVGFLSGIAC